jgi:hypothetical protein
MENVKVYGEGEEESKGYGSQESTSIMDPIIHSPFIEH